MCFERFQLSLTPPRLGFSGRLGSDPNGRITTVALVGLQLISTAGGIFWKGVGCNLGFSFCGLGDFFWDWKKVGGYWWEDSRRYHIICQLVREGDDDTATMFMRWYLLWWERWAKRVIARRNLMHPSHRPLLLKWGVGWGGHVSDYLSRALVWSFGNARLWQTYGVEGFHANTHTGTGRSSCKNCMNVWEWYRGWDA